MKNNEIIILKKCKCFNVKSLTRKKMKSKIQPEGMLRNDAGKILRAVLNYKKIFSKKRNFFDGSGWTDQWKRAILLE